MIKWVGGVDGEIVNRLLVMTEEGVRSFEHGYKMDCILKELICAA